MRIIEGFQEAKAILSRQGLSGSPLTPLTPELKPKEVPAADKAEQQVRGIINEVRNKDKSERDEVLRNRTSEFDKIEITTLEISKEQIASACKEIDEELISALKLAAERIRAFHTAQKDNIWKEFFKEGSGQLIRPLQRVGIYTPGGTADYPSTVLMTAVPAKVAGVEEVILVTPPRENVVIPVSTLVAADIAGVDRIFSVGGAQAIAALAFGTESIPKVDKICGPGNIFVTLAKKMVYGEVDIDGLQGPSEVLIIADEKTNPGYCAADLLAQAEHDPLASVILVTTSRGLMNKVCQQIKQQLKDIERQVVVKESLENNGVMAVVDSMDEAIELANLYAPEHLCLMVEEATSYIDKISNAGCIFIGEDSTVVLGDYVAGPSHVLPTGGTARFSSPLNVSDFIKFINFVNLDKADLKRLGQAAATIARAEGFEAHARAVERRLKRDA